jgi:hypothetical protein
MSGQRWRERGASPLGCDCFQLAMIVAVLPVRMVQVAAHQVIDVIAVRDALMPAVRAVDVIGLMLSALVIGRAALQIRAGRSHSVLVHVVVVNVMHMTVVQIVGVAIMFYCGVSAIRSMRMGMILMLGAGASHRFMPLSPTMRAFPRDVNACAGRMAPYGTMARYSRSACIGSTRAARRAGSTSASPAAVSSRMLTAASVAGSCGATPYSMLVR